jgi:hypothetical protein
MDTQKSKVSILRYPNHTTLSKINQIQKIIEISIKRIHTQETWIRFQGSWVRTSNPSRNEILQNRRIDVEICKIYSF